MTDWSALARDLLQAEHPISAGPRAVASRAVEPTARRVHVGPRLLETLHHIRHAARTLAAQPLFALTTVLTFALGIGATTLVYTLVQTVLIAPLPYHAPDQLAFVQQVVPEIAERYPVMGVNPRSFVAWRASCHTTCDTLAAVEPDTATLTGAGEPEALTGARVSPELFDLLGIQLARGRAFDETDTTPGRSLVAVITYGLWQRRFGGDAEIIGRRISLDDQPIEVVGVLHPSFRFPQIAHSDRTGRISNAPDYLRPIVWPGWLRTSWGEYGNAVLLRLRPGASVEAAQAELTSITNAEFAKTPVHPCPVVQPLADAVTACSSAWRPPSRT